MKALSVPTPSNIAQAPSVPTPGCGADHSAQAPAITLRRTQYPMNMNFVPRFDPGRRLPFVVPPLCPRRGGFQARLPVSTMLDRLPLRRPVPEVPATR
jgi:hypothetical protein